jgi:glycerophosphoryl diester phosphodiesterase
MAPENTLAAMAEGVARGYRMVEFDAKLSADGVPVLMHDETLDRTTDGTGPVAARTLRELSVLDAGGWYDPRFAGEPVPTLEAVARWLIEQGVAADIEIKPCPGRSAETGRVVAQAAQALWEGAACAPLLSSFSQEALEAARSVAPSLSRAWLLRELRPDWHAVASRLGCIAIGVEHSALDAQTVRDMRGAGFGVFAYTVAHAATAARLRDWGVDAIVTDALDAMGP